VRASVVETFNARSKADRIIEAFDAVLAAGALGVHRAVWETPFIAEMREWQPASGGGRDDGLDAVAHCLLAEPVRLVRTAPPPSQGPEWRPGGGMWTASTDFSL